MAPRKQKQHATVPTGLRPAGKGITRYSADLTRRQLEFITQALLADVNEREIIRQGNAPPHDLCLSRNRLSSLRIRIHAEWDRASIERRAYAREMQILRITKRMRMLDRALHDKPLDTKLHRQISKYESQLMDIMGTREAIKVDVDVRVSQSISGVIANLSPEQVAEMLERRKRLEFEAEQARHLLSPAAE